MLRLDRRLDAAPAGHCGRSLCLSYAERCRSRLRVRLDDGNEAGVFLPRGTVLRGGESLGDADGNRVRVVAAIEALYEVRPVAISADPAFDLLRAAYHLGNRHVPVELAPDRLLLERDSVLRDLLLRLGLAVQDVMAPFEPEAGAYGGGHRHDHDPVGGSLGEQLSQQAHARPVPDFAAAHFTPCR